MAKVFFSFLEATEVNACVADRKGKKVNKKTTVTVIACLSVPKDVVYVHVAVILGSEQKFFEWAGPQYTTTGEFLRSVIVSAHPPRPSST